ncbi:MAG: alpha/beta hydrolase [Leptospiraceae bacterium]|nr:alpha/beta hydrolase [Leptospiraceae bacterium]
MKEFISEYAEYFKKLDFDLMGAFLVSLDKCDLNPILHQIKAKTLFIAGKEDLIVGSHNSIEASARVKGSELLILNHSGHMPIYEEKEATIGKMKSWLKS